MAGQHVQATPEFLPALPSSISHSSSACSPREKDPKSLPSTCRREPMLRFQASISHLLLLQGTWWVVEDGPPCWAPESNPQGSVLCIPQ